VILRRLSQHLREQNWTAISIEFVLLVLGVFLGIQVANWNEQRADSARAQAYLVRLQDDFERDLFTIQRSEEYWRKVRDYGQQAIRYAETGETAGGSAWKTVLAFYQASQIQQWFAMDATYQEMRSSGELGLIHDQALRAAMSRYYAGSASAAYLYSLQPEYRKSVRGLTPQVVADHIWAKCVHTPDRDHQHLLDCDAPISGTDAQAVLDGYLRDPRLLPELRFWVANQGVALSGLGNYKPILHDMKARAEAEARR
jgi:hypothetical protein